MRARSAAFASRHAERKPALACASQSHASKDRTKSIGEQATNRSVIALKSRVSPAVYDNLNGTRRGCKLHAALPCRVTPKRMTTSGAGKSSRPKTLS